MYMQPLLLYSVWWKGLKLNCDSSILEILFSRQFSELKDTEEFFFIPARVQICDVWNGEIHNLSSDLTVLYTFEHL